MTNPFDDETGIHIVLRNEEEQYSLWPAFIDVPAGWQVVHPADSRKACLEFVDSNWTDMRPKTLRSLAPSTPPAPVSSGRHSE
jgi:MbtH protein